jgi:hypothetical protein
MGQTMTNRSNTASAGLGGPSAVDYRVRGLLDALRRSPSSLDVSIPAGFDRLFCFAESLPLASAEFALVRNWIVGARDLWEQGESRAALYQVKLACKKLQIMIAATC